MSIRLGRKAESEVELNKLGLSCAKLSTAEANYILAYISDSIAGE